MWGFAFGIKTAWITQQCFGCCWAPLVQYQVLLTLFPRLEGWDCTIGWQETYSGELPQTDQRVISYHMTSYSAIKLMVRRRKQKFQSCENYLSFQAPIMQTEALFTRRQLDTCPPMGNSELIHIFALLAHPAFIFPIKLSSSWFTSPFAFLQFPPAPIPSKRGVRESQGQYLAAVWGQPITIGLIKYEGMAVIRGRTLWVRAGDLAHSLLCNKSYIMFPKFFFQVQ